MCDRPTRTALLRPELYRHLLTFTSNGMGTTPGAMSDLVINLGAVTDGQVEAPEHYKVALSNPSTTSVATSRSAPPISPTTITYANPASWSITGDRPSPKAALRTTR